MSMGIEIYEPSGLQPEQSLYEAASDALWNGMAGVGGFLKSSASTVVKTTSDVAFNAIQGTARAVSGGVVSGVTGDLIKQVGDTVGETAKKVAKDVSSDLGQQIKAAMSEVRQADLGKQLGDYVKREGEGFIKSINLDPNALAADAAAKASEAAQSFVKNMKTEDVVKKFVDQFEKGLDLNNRVEILAERLNTVFDGFSLRLGDSLAEASTNLSSKLRNEFMFHQLPYLLAATAALVATPLLVGYIYYNAKHTIGRPKLATNVVQKTMLTPLTNIFSRVSTAAPKPIYNAELERRITEISSAVKNIHRHGGYFQNVLFYGPGGTGKTMISEKIAKESGLSYVKMSGGDLAQYIKRGEHVTELNKLLDKMETSWRPWSSRPWIFFIDEAESLCRDRSSLPSAELLELQNALLNRTGTQSKKFMMILSTNRVEDLDEAVLSRMDHKIFIGPPAEQERFGIIKSYLPQFFSPKEIEKYFSDEQVLEIAKRAEGITGRGLFKMLNTLSTKRAMTDDNMITQAMVDVTVNDTICQEDEVCKRREARHALLTAMGPMMQLKSLPTSQAA